MNYKGYIIIAEVDVNEQWDFEETPKGIHLTSFLDSGGADEANITDFIIKTEDDEYPDWAEDHYDTLEKAKEAIDAHQSN